MPISSDFVARVLGYSLGFKDFSKISPNLPQRVALLAPISSDKESGFADYDKKITISTVAEAYERFGISPIYMSLRILKPVNGGGLGSVPVDVYPISVSTGTAATGTITPAVSTAATANATHTIKFNGRSSIDGFSATFLVEEGDVVADITAKITTAINGMLRAPISAADGTTLVNATARWKGELGNQISIDIDTNGNDAGVSYAFGAFTGGADTADVSTALTNFGDTWETMVLNSFGSGQFDALESFNGVPNPTTGGSGRWNAAVMKPFVAVAGSVSDDEATLLSFGATRKEDMTNSLVPAPRSEGYTFEVAANWIALMALEMDQRPHATIADKFLPDLPSPTGDAIGDMSDYLTRNSLVEGGISTVTYNDSRGYRVEDFITFRRPDGQSPTAVDWRYVRDIIGIDFNVFYTYRLIEERELFGKTIVDDDATITGSISADTIKLKQWKALVFGMFDELAERALIVEPSFSKESLVAGLNEINPKRIDTEYNYKRSATVRIGSTDAYAGFQFGGN